MLVVFDLLAGLITVMYASESFAELECRVSVKHPARRNSGRLDATAVQVAVVLHLGVAIGFVVNAASTALPKPIRS